MQAMVLLADIVCRNTRAERVSRGENEGEVDSRLLGRPDIVPDLEKLGTPDHLVDGADPQPGHDSAHLVGDVIKEVDHVFRRTLEFGTEMRILGGDTNGASVQVAFLGED